MNQGKEPKTNWLPVTREEIKAFLGINIATRIVNLPKAKSYWEKEITCFAWFPSIMSRPIFEQICQYLHLADNSKEPDKDSKEYKLYKLGKIEGRAGRASNGGRKSSFACLSCAQLMQWWFILIKTLSLAREGKHTSYSIKSWHMSWYNPS